MQSLSQYKVTFSRTFIGLWTWRAVGPDGESFGSPLGCVAVTKEGAELDAAREIRRRMSRETIDGSELFGRINEREGSMDWQRSLPGYVDSSAGS